MTKRLLILLTIISILTHTGCGGGRGGDENPSTNIGAIQGTVSFGPSSSSISISSIALKPNNFVKKSFYQSKSAFEQQSVANEKIVKLRPGLSDQEAANIIAGIGGNIKKKLYGTESTYLVTINDQIFSKSSASQNFEIEYVEDNLKFQAFATPNDEYFTSPYYWNYNMLNLQSAWDIQKGDSGTVEIIVAVLDTGISLTHPDFKDKNYLESNLISGYDFVGEGEGDDDPFDEGTVSFSHGTHVAGIISAFAGNEIGIAGVAWNVTIMPIRVLGANGEGSSVDIIQGINWAVSHGANIINMSLGLTGPQPGQPGTETFIKAIDNAIANGVTVVAAAGNDGASIVAFPANYKKVIAVAAIDHTGSKAPYSNYGSEIDFCAPGGGQPRTLSELDWAIKTILSTCYDKGTKNDCYVYMAGTSQATPHISGLAALLYAKGVTSPTDIESHLRAGCIDLGNSSYYGNGLPDAYAVLTGENPLMVNVKVFIGKPDGTIISNLQHVGASGSFTISDLKAGTYCICAFEDKNDDNVVDIEQEEKFAYRQVTLTANTLLIGVDISL